jgi:hypothetical protein
MRNFVPTAVAVMVVALAVARAAASVPFEVFSITLETRGTSGGFAPFKGMATALADFRCDA